VLGLSMWYYAGFNLFTDYRREALARALQGFGLAFLFIPTSQLAYSNLPANKNNKASSLTNLFRNLGGSVGIAFVTTLLERRSQYHQSVLVTHLTATDPTLQLTLGRAVDRLISAGYTSADALVRAPAQLGAIVRQQSALLGALDCFWFLGALAMIGPLLALGIRSFDQGGSGTKSGGH
jgi:DHA2 family multidrug resistance protein